VSGFIEVILLDRLGKPHVNQYALPLDVSVDAAGILWLMLNNMPVACHREWTYYRVMENR
jgi:hypothetical protein